MSAALPAPPRLAALGPLLGPRAVPAAVLALGVLVGLLTGMQPTFGVALALGIAFAVVVIWDLAVGLALFVLVTYLDVVSAEQQLSVTKAVGLLLALSWLMLVATRGRPRNDLFASHPWFIVLVGGFVAWSALSVVWADRTGAAINDTLRYGLNVVLLPIVFTAVRERRHVVWLLVVFSVGIVLSAAYGQVTGIVGAGHQEGRLAGARLEANQLAAMLVVGTVFAVALAATWRRSPLLRAGALGLATISLLATFATLSRAGMLALAGAVVVGILFGGRWRAWPAVLAVVAVAVGGFYLASAETGVTERLTSSNTSGRQDLWTVGMRVVADNPVLGAGVGNSRFATADYVVQPGLIAADQFIVDEHYAVHNIYLHVLADLGIVGFLLFAGILLYALWTGVKAARTFQRQGDARMEVLSRAVVAGLVAILVADFFASEQFSKQLWVLLGLAPALLALAQRGEREQRPSATT